jgi:type I restriction enzyme S subunit
VRLMALGDIVDFKGGGTPDKSVPAYWGGSVPWASVKDFKSTTLDRTTDFITQEGVRNSATNVIPAGTVIVPTRMAVGKAAIATVDMAINQDLKALLPKQDISTRFLLHALLASSGELERQASGATVKGITLNVLRELEIYLPRRPEQQRLAAILDQANQVHKLAVEVVRRSDLMIAAEYSHCFGDPRSNPLNWPVSCLSEVLDEIEGGWSPNCLERPASENEWGVLKLGSVTYGRFDQSANKALPANVAPKAYLAVSRGDILFSRKNTYDLVGASTLVMEDTSRMLIPDLVFRLKLKNHKALVSAEYLQTTLSFQSMRVAIRSLASGAAGSMPNISKGKLFNLAIPIPPMDLQRRFTGFRQAHEAQRRKLIHRATKANALFASLQHRAFRGEL